MLGALVTSLLESKGSGSRSVPQGGKGGHVHALSVESGGERGRPHECCSS